MTFPAIYHAFLSVTKENIQEGINLEAKCFHPVQKCCKLNTSKVLAAWRL